MTAEQTWYCPQCQHLWRGNYMSMVYVDEDTSLTMFPHYTCPFCAQQQGGIHG
jgi:hypothetical protein